MLSKGDWLRAVKDHMATTQGNGLSVVRKGDLAYVARVRFNHTHQRGYASYDLQLIRLGDLAERVGRYEMRTCWEKVNVTVTDR